MTAIDLAEDTEIGSVSKVLVKARELYKLDHYIKEQEEKLKEFKTKLNYLATEELPDLMQEEGFDELPLQQGYKLKLKDVVAASIPTQANINKTRDSEKQQHLQNRRDIALQFLRDNNADSLISNLVVINIPKSENGKRLTEELMLSATALGLEAMQEESVHPRTLVAYITEELSKEDGLDIPVEPFALFTGKKAIIETTKNPKGKTNAN